MRGLEQLLLADDDETTLVVGTWAYQGSGSDQPRKTKPSRWLPLPALASTDQWRATQRKTTTRERTKRYE